MSSTTIDHLEQKHQIANSLEDGDIQLQISDVGCDGATVVYLVLSVDGTSQFGICLGEDSSEELVKLRTLSTTLGYEFSKDLTFLIGETVTVNSYDTTDQQISIAEANLSEKDVISSETIARRSLTSHLEPDVYNGIQRAARYQADDSHFSAIHIADTAVRAGTLVATLELYGHSIKWGLDIPDNKTGADAPYTRLVNTVGEESVKLLSESTVYTIRAEHMNYDPQYFEDPIGTVSDPISTWMDFPKKTPPNAQTTHKNGQKSVVILAPVLKHMIIGRYPCRKYKKV